MGKPSVAIRLATEGKARVKDDFAEIASAGDATARRLTASYDEQIAAAERASERARRTAEKIAAIAPQSAMQMRVNDATGTGYSQHEGSARRSAAAMQELIAEQERMEAQARRMISAIDPLFAAQLRYDQEVARATELHRAGTLSVERYQQILRAQLSTLDAARDAHLRHGAAVRGNGMAGVQAGAQIQDFFIQVGAGQSVIVAGSQQLSQLAFVMQGAQGAAGKFAAFLTSGWGTAILAGVSVLSLIIPKLMETGDALEKSTDDLRKQAKEAETGREAQERFKSSVEGVRAAILDAEAARKESIKGLQTEAEQANIAAKGYLEKEVRIRDATVAMLEQARIAERILGGPGISSERGIGVAQAAARQRAEYYESLLPELQSLIDRAKSELLATQADLADEAARRALDPVERIKRKYEGPDGLIVQAKRRAEAEGKVTAELTKQLTALRQQMDAKVRVAQEEERKGRQRPDGDLTRFIWPVDGRFTGTFNEQRGNRRHAGVDIAVPVGTNVGAAAGGIVIESGNLPGYGNVIIIDHGRGTTTRYAHLSKLLAGEGQRVSAGDLIGLSGGAKGAPGSGNSRGPHVHYEVREGKKPVDPRGRVFATDLFETEDRAAEAGVKRAKEAAEQLKRMRDEASRLVDQLDPAAGSMRQLSDELEKIAMWRDKGVISPDVALQLSLAASRRAGAEQLKRDGDAIKRITGSDDGGLGDSLKHLREQDPSRGMDAIDAGAERRADLAERRDLLELELSLAGKSERVRERALMLRQRELELIREFGPEYADTIRQLLDEEAAQADLAAEIARVSDSLEEARAIGESFVDTLFDPRNWEDWGDLGEKVLADLRDDLLRLALLNPLKNWLFGQDNPTMKSVLSALGGVGSLVGGATKQLPPLDPSKGPMGLATGTEYFGGGLTWVAENGPELISLPRGSRVTPAAETRRVLSGAGAGAAPPLNFNYNIDATGADSAAIARLQAQLAEDRAYFIPKVVEAVQEALSRNALR